jgi:hypothetical protein
MAVVASLGWLSDAKMRSEGLEPHPHAFGSNSDRVANKEERSPCGGRRPVY